MAHAASKSAPVDSPISPATGHSVLRHALGKIAHILLAACRERLSGSFALVSHKFDAARLRVAALFHEFLKAVQPLHIERHLLVGLVVDDLRTLRRNPGVAARCPAEEVTAPTK